jgi:tyrosyl-tRNA synthetase
VGGSDQWANILAGADLIRRVEGGKAYGLVAPLITASSGRKVSKSEGNAVFLDPTLTSPYEFYQFWINTEDADVERYLAIYTFLPMNEVRALGRLDGAELRRAKEVLAFEATRLVHGEEATRRAEETSRALFRGEAATLDAAPTTELSEEEVATGLPIVEVVVRAGLEASKNRARTLIDQRGLRLNGELVEAADRILRDDDFPCGAALLRKGQKTYHRLVVRSG